MSRSKKKRKDSPNTSSQTEPTIQSKWLTQGLIFSVALNLALLTSLVFNVIKGKENPHKANKYLAKTHEQSSSLEQMLIRYSEKTYPDLIEMLDSNKHIEDGFSNRDLALSVLSNQYDLDVDRALMGQATIMRYIPIQGAVGQTYEYPVFSGLSDSQYRLIDMFIKNEEWPLTSHGLFKKLSQNTNDESLRNAFFLSREFMYIEGLFCSLNVSKEILLNILLKGPWENLSEFISEHRQIQDFSNALRVRFLSRYLEVGSEYAARLILEIDAPYALKKLEDSQIVALLGLLENKTQIAENFAVHLVLGNRKDWVRQEACRLLYHYLGQDFPEPYSYSSAMSFIAHHYNIDPSHTLAASLSSASDFVPNDETTRVYIVQEGDNLWKIAKKNQVSLDELRQVNHLDSDLIKVGMRLKLP